MKKSGTGDELLLSVIIPIYNVGKYVAKCLASVFDQGIAAERYEIIVVDDSSPDDSRSIVESIAAANPNIRIIEQKPNAGQGAARNMGMDAARGKYIMFVDPDDYLAPDSLSEMTDIMEAQRLDMLGADYRIVDEAGKESEEWRRLLDMSPEAEVPVSGCVFLTENRCAFTVWGYMFRREFLNAHSLRMLPVRAHEDEDFIPRAICLSERIRFHPRVVYYYLRRGDSTMNNYSINKMVDMIDCMANLDNFRCRVLADDPEMDLHLRRYINAMLRMLIRNNKKYRYGDGRELTRRMKNHGLMPILNPSRSFTIWMVNLFPESGLIVNGRKRKQATSSDVTGSK